MSNLPLPDGWIQQHDTKYNRPFWVDTRAHPLRIIWVHPYEDEQFLAAHPAQARSGSLTDLGDAPPTYDDVTGGQASGSSKEKSDFKAPQEPESNDAAGPSKPAQHKRGVFGRLKDKAIGTKEEREEQRRVRADQAARAEERARQRRMRELEEREAYMRAHGGYGQYHPSGGPVYVNAPAPTRNPGFDNTAALLFGGMAGGLLLGDIFGGGF
ncbi:hypothetical protein JVU11DRAFT_5035 [Chiua virens]|nr:hypothetical protein JVU11DRAFT_5035 [Chiua virens]